MEWYKKTDEQKKRLSKSKIDKCKKFTHWLNENRINHSVNNNGYHIQVQIQHNFYPSKGTYYNSESGKKFYYKKFKTVNDFYKFLQDNVS